MRGSRARNLEKAQLGLGWEWVHLALILVQELDQLDLEFTRALLLQAQANLPLPQCNFWLQVQQY